MVKKTRDKEKMLKEVGHHFGSTVEMGSRLLLEWSSDRSEDRGVLMSIGKGTKNNVQICGTRSTTLALLGSLVDSVAESLGVPASVIHMLIKPSKETEEKAEDEDGDIAKALLCIYNDLKDRQKELDTDDD